MNYAHPLVSSFLKKFNFKHSHFGKAISKFILCHSWKRAWNGAITWGILNDSDFGSIFLNFSLQSMCQIQSRLTDHDGPLADIAVVIPPSSHDISPMLPRFLCCSLALIMLASLSLNLLQPSAACVPASLPRVRVACFM